MSSNDVKKSKKGLKIGTMAPIIDTTDIYGNKIKSREILNDSQGFLIDFFRGAF